MDSLDCNNGDVSASDGCRPRSPRGPFVRRLRVGIVFTLALAIIGGLPGRALTLPPAAEPPAGEQEDKLVIGTPSITGGDDADGGWRLGDLPELPQNRVLSLEPMLSRVPPECLDNVFSAVDWLIIGGLTGRKPFTPPREWVEPLVEWGRARGVPVFLKDSVRYPEIVREYPAAISAVRQKPAGVPGEWGMCDNDEC